MSPFTRRHFLKTSLAASAAAGIGQVPLLAQTSSQSSPATEPVSLGKSGLRVTRLAFGTGSENGYIQAALGQQQFTRLVHHAYDRGIRFFETAESYVTPAMLGEALKPFPRDSYHLMSKVTTDDDPDPLRRLDQMRRTSQTDYFDIMLLHWQHTSDWVSRTTRWQDAISEAQSKQHVRTRGASVHGLPALRQMPGNRWLQIAMIRMNHNGTRMDGPTSADSNYPANVPEVVQHVHRVHQQGMGVISMKLVGDGAFTHRQAAMRFAFQTAHVDCVTVGLKNTAEIDEAIDNLNLALA
jgi:aryl-alcohol dehydrogenase-like predicted oxidoreductase